ncbi:MAG: hypothetical protein M0D53_15415 [Flavobacterium sp. JAD_PAG50586_2]|nr:MAG: hypothetical protein M0D53_15415 [Flavobacterium sp. JAD_PAG50586_2]
MIDTMQYQFNNYLFKTSGVSEYQLFWVTYEITKRCSDTELGFVNYGNYYCRLSIVNSSLSAVEIGSILTENQIEYETIP